jgi:hypothetical protein
MLSAMVACTRLTCLCLTGLEAGLDEVDGAAALQLGAMLQQLQHLAHIDLSASGIAARAAVALLQGLGGHPSVTHLDFSDVECYSSAEPRRKGEQSPSISASMPCLQHLAMAGIPLGGADGVRVVALLPHLSVLTTWTFDAAT